MQLASGEWKLLQGLGTGAALEAKCDYRVEECLTMARVLQAINSGGCRLDSCLMFGCEILPVIFVCAEEPTVTH
jgi:hypothetical protein